MPASTYAVGLPSISAIVTKSIFQCYGLASRGLMGGSWLTWNCRRREDAYRLIMATWAQCSGYANLFTDSRGDDADASGARIRARACPEPCPHLTLLPQQHVQQALALSARPGHQARSGCVGQAAGSATHSGTPCELAVNKTLLEVWECLLRFRLQIWLQYDMGSTTIGHR